MTSGMTTRHPTAEDAAGLWRLIDEVGGLERNTCYAYVLLCTHFARTSLIAERDGNMAGFVLGYRPPQRSDAMFVWQVGVHPSARGTGLATALLRRFVGLPAFEECRYLEATVGTTNEASRALFRGFARKHRVTCDERSWFPGRLFAEAGHEDEDLFRIGPLEK